MILTQVGVVVPETLCYAAHTISAMGHDHADCAFRLDHWRQQRPMTEFEPSMHTVTASTSSADCRLGGLSV